MTRDEILQEITQMLGAVPDWLGGMPDAVLRNEWPRLAWLLSDSALTAKEKALVAFGTAGAVHCPY